MVASYKIDTFGMPPDDARELWREIVAETYELDESCVKDSGYRLASQLWLVEDLLFSKLKAEANAIARTHALIASKPASLLKVRVFLRGGSRLQIDSETFALEGGAIYFIDHDRPSHEFFSDHEQFSIFVPHHAIEYDQTVHPAVFSLGLNSAPGRLLEASLNAAFRELEGLETYEAPAFVETVKGTLRGAISSVIDSEANVRTRKARIAGVKRFIDQHLDDASLGANQILHAFNLSRATLFRDFADVGGVNRHILSRRIQRAYRDLSEAAPTRGVIQQVSERWGFGSLAHFSRAFKEQYGTAPTSVLGQWMDKDQDPVSGKIGQEAGRADVTEANVAALRWSYNRFS